MWILFFGEKNLWRKTKLFSKRKLFGIPLGLLLLLVSGIVIASLIGYIANVQISATKQSVLEVRHGEDGETWSSWEDGEELNLLWDIGSVYSYTGERFYQMKCKDSFGSTANVIFEITDPHNVITVINQETLAEINHNDGFTLTTSIFEFSILVDIPLWLHSGYDFTDLGVKVVPVST